MKDAITVARRMGIISRSVQRDRRPSLEELDTLLAHFIERRKRTPQAMPMHKVIMFALFSTRRQAEITRITWNDFEKKHRRVLVRDMKHPGEKIGNDTWVDLPEETIQVIESMPKTKPEIFPYSPDAITANFTRACKLLGINDLRFHDLRGRFRNEGDAAPNDWATQCISSSSLDRRQNNRIHVIELRSRGLFGDQGWHERRGLKHLRVWETSHRHVCVSMPLHQQAQPRRAAALRAKHLATSGSAQPDRPYHLLAEY